MNFALNDEQLEFKAALPGLRPRRDPAGARRHDDDESIPWEVIKEAREQGLARPRADAALGRRRRRPDAA